MQVFHHIFFASAKKTDVYVFRTCQVFDHNFFAYFSHMKELLLCLFRVFRICQVLDQYVFAYFLHTKNKLLWLFCELSPAARAIERVTDRGKATEESSSTGQKKMEAEPECRGRGCLSRWPWSSRCRRQSQSSRTAGCSQPLASKDSRKKVTRAFV